MQLNTTAALVTAIVSAVIGFGLAFYIEKKLSGNMQKKSQKILTSIAMISFGYGLMATLNEVIGFPLQGLQIRSDKLIVYVIANMLFLPIIFISIAKFIGAKNKSFEVPLSTQAPTVGRGYLKYILIIIGGTSIAYFGYVAYEGNSSGSTYDLYSKVDFKNCNSAFAEKPYVSLKFDLKKETNEIFMTGVRLDEKENTKQIKKLENCSVLDAKNWTCGGEWQDTIKKVKHSMIDGELSIDPGFNPFLSERCSIKVVKR
jgi:hypothetical protein